MHNSLHEVAAASEGVVKGCKGVLYALVAASSVGAHYPEGLLFVAVEEVLVKIVLALEAREDGLQAAVRQAAPGAAQREQAQEDVPAEDHLVSGQHTLEVVLRG